MQRLRQLLNVEYEFQNPQAQQQAHVITSLNPIMLVLAGVLVLIGLTFFNTANETIIFLSAGFFMVMLVVGSVQLLRGGRSTAASLLYVAMTTGIALWVLYLDGLPSQTILVLAIPIILAGILVDRRYTRWATGIIAIGLLVIALVQGGGWEGGRSPWVAFLPAIVLVIFVGEVQEIVNREVSGNLVRLAEAQTNQNVTLALSEKLSPETTLDNFMRQFGLALHDTYGLQQVQVFLRDPSNPNLIVQRLGIGVAAQRAQAAGRQVFVAADNVIAAAIRQKEPMVVHSSSMAMYQDELLPGSRSEVLLPMMVNGTAIGVLDLQSPHVDDFRSEQVPYLSAMANAFGAMIQGLQFKNQFEELTEEQARLYAHLESNAAETQRLRRQVSGVIWDRFFRERGQDVLGFDIHAADNQPVPSGELNETMETSLEAGAVDVRPTENGYLLTVPIKQRNDVLGVMEFALDGAEEVPLHIIDLATIVAERLSLALDNARLVEQTQATAYREQQVGDITRRLQSADNLEMLINTAVTEFNSALGGVQTHIRLQLEDSPNSPSSQNGGGAS